ncbi:MAG: methyltransferase family protein [Candidatus Kariarchaeaceae archaeon]|jgi:protein-S-isoprenylcysteine O-methyltransferase Ste14
MTESTEPETMKVTWTMLFKRFTIMVVLLVACLFIPAGTVNYWQGWAYVLTVIVFTFLGRAQAMLTNPEMLNERLSALDDDEVAEWDKKIVQVIGIFGPLIMLLISGLDIRFGWTGEMSLTIQLTSLGILFLSMFLGNWAMLTNKFFSSVVRIQEDRGHYVIKEGPYHYVRHPGYLAGLIGNGVSPLLLGSLWAYIPVVLMTIVLMYRLFKEDNTLRQELDGYEEYTNETRYRLIPFIW